MADASRISILMYHQVGRFPPMGTHRANYCDQGRFTRQMGLIARLGCRVLDLDTALACLSGRIPTPARALVLTFDDAYDNFADSALPILQRHGFPATVYAISGWLGRRAEWFAKDPGRDIPALMSAERLREIQAAGMTIGSHTVNHVKLGESVRHLCYPFGSFDLGAVRAAAAAGYATATTCLRGAATAADHPLALPRKAISYGDNLIGFWWKLAVKHAPKPALTEWRERLAREPRALESPRRQA